MNSPQYKYLTTSSKKKEQKGKYINRRDQIKRRRKSGTWLQLSFFSPNTIMKTTLSFPYKTFHCPTCPFEVSGFCLSQSSWHLWLIIGIQIFPIRSSKSQTRLRTKNHAYIIKKNCIQPFCGDLPGQSNLAQNQGTDQQQSDLLFNSELYDIKNIIISKFI